MRTKYTVVSGDCKEKMNELEKDSSFFFLFLLMSYNKEEKCVSELNEAYGAKVTSFSCQICT